MEGGWPLKNEKDGEEERRTESLPGGWVFQHVFNKNQVEALSQGPRKLCYYFPTGDFLRLHVTLLIHGRYLQHHGIFWDLVSYMVQAAQTYCRAPSCSVTHLRLVAFCVTCPMGQRSILMCHVMPLKPKEPYRTQCYFCKCKLQQLVLYLGENFQERWIWKIVCVTSSSYFPTLTGGSW